MLLVILNSAIAAVIIMTVSDVLYAVERTLCRIVAFLNNVFELFAGLQPILYTPDVTKYQYDPNTLGMQVVSEGGSVQEKTTLLDMIFHNSTINVIFWDMALIGIAMVFGFALFAVIKKMFDHRDKMTQTMGSIIGNSVKAIGLIVSLNVIVAVLLTGTQTLLNTMVDAFDNAAGQDISVTITYDEEDYAAMLRSINTIANYSLNKHYDSRYNLNSCFNDIQKDLSYLEGKGVFRYPYRYPIAETGSGNDEIVSEYSGDNYAGDAADYNDDEISEEELEKKINEDAESTDMNDINNVVNSVFSRSKKDVAVQLSGEDSWQSVLYDIAAFNNGEPVYLDSYDESRNNALLYAMDVIRNKADFQALESYTVTRYGKDQTSIRIDRLIMLIGTIDAADESKYNENMSFTDDLRGQYLYGYRDIYNHSQMEAGFNYFIFVWHHLLVIFVAILFIKQFLGMCFNAVARVFNMIFLYLVAPPFLAVMPLDEGGKAKQWTTSFIIQTFSLFGTVLAMRLYLVLIPIVINTNVIFFPDDSGAQMLAQLVFLLGCAYVVQKSGGLIMGILADNAGMQAIRAGDMMAEAGGLVETVKGALVGAASFAGGQLMSGAKQGQKEYDKKKGQ